MGDRATLEGYADMAFQHGQIELCQNPLAGENWDRISFREAVFTVDERHGDNIKSYLDDCIRDDNGEFNNDRVYHFAALAVAATRGCFTEENESF